MAQTPPCHLPNIPGVTSPGTLIEDSKVEVNNLNNLNNHDRKHAVGKRIASIGVQEGDPRNLNISSGLENIDASFITNGQLIICLLSSPSPLPSPKLIEMLWKP